MRRLLLACSLLCGLAAPASADILYGGGAINGTNNATLINSGSSVTNSFTLTADGTLTAVDQIGLWAEQGTVPTQVAWAIGTTAFGSEVASGTATLTNTPFLTPNSSGYDVYASSFTLPDIDLTAGDYWLTLSNGVTALPGQLFWDQNNGPSTAFEKDAFGDPTPRPSNAFQITGNQDVDPLVAPEPMTLAVFGLMAVGAGCVRRRNKATP